jgi:hypothetical protein
MKGNEEIDGLFIACGGSPHKKNPRKNPEAFESFN